MTTSNHVSFDGQVGLVTGAASGLGLAYSRLLAQRGAQVVISQMPRRRSPLEIDREVYKWRHLIENFFCKLKEFKRIAMRSDKTDSSYLELLWITLSPSCLIIPIPA